MLGHTQQQRCVAYRPNATASAAAAHTEPFTFSQNRNWATVTSTALLGFSLSPLLNTGANATGEPLLPSLLCGRALNFDQNHEKRLLTFIHGEVTNPVRRDSRIDHGPRRNDQARPFLCCGCFLYLPSNHGVGFGFPRHRDNCQFP